MVYRLNVFVGSSTLPKEIKEYRWAARDAILDAGMNPVMYEHVRKYFTGGTPSELSRKMIDETEIFVGFYSGQYGELVAGGNTDWAEFEYDYALMQKKPMLLFMPSNQHIWSSQNDSRFKQFKEKIQIFYHKLYNPENFRSQLTGLLRTSAFEKIADESIVVQPIFGRALLHSQYDADIFMIMPFDNRFKPVYDDCIIPTVRSMGLSIKRGDNFFNVHSIMDDVWSATFHAKAVIADLTDKNTNVFYELGIAHTLGKKFIMLTQREEDVPFDLRNFRFIKYDPDDYPRLQADLKIALEQLQITG